MNDQWIKIMLIVFLLPNFSIVLANINAGGPSKKDSASIIDHLDVSGQWFLSYLVEDKHDQFNKNRFTLKRGYLTFKQKLNHRFSVRFTQDITLDQEGEDAGNVELRLKYCYLNMHLDNMGFLYKPRFEFGLVHRPWLDFEQHINRYRVQGRMFLERYGVINSADFGITFSTLLGGELNDSYQEQVNGSYPGRYGSLVLGVYNGPGYHAIEANDNKTFESRLSIRPLPDYIPGLQLSYSNVFGRANNIHNSRFTSHNIYISSESKYHVFAAQVYKGISDYDGFYTDTTTGRAFRNEGLSFFGEIKLFNSKLCAFGRYDVFNTDKGPSTIRKNRYIAGLSSYFYKRNKILCDFDLYENHDTNELERIYEIAIEIVF